MFMSCNGDALRAFGQDIVSYPQCPGGLSSHFPLLIFLFFFTFSAPVFYEWPYECVCVCVCFYDEQPVYCKCRPRLGLLKFQPSIWCEVALRIGLHGGVASTIPTRYFIAEKCNHKTFKAPNAVQRWGTITNRS